MPFAFCFKFEAVVGDMELASRANAVLGDRFQSRRILKFVAISAITTALSSPGK
jgi:hypothetical protein